MKKSTILARLAETGIRQEAEKVVPANGAPVPLPYHVVRVDEVEDGDDLGRVRIKTLTWTVALFTKNKDFALECKILAALQGCKLDLLTLNRTGLDDAGLLQAASIPRLSHIQIDHTAVTYEGLLTIAGNSRIEPVAHVQFTQEQMEHFSQLQREKAKKPVQLDEQAAEECRRVLSAFFAEMTEWERYMEQAGFEDAQAVPRLLAIWEKYVSEKPRPGYRPLGLSYSAQGTYNGEEFLDAEQITKNKLYIYTREKNIGFDRRFLMKRVGEGWKIDAVQERLNGWQRTEL